VWVGGCGWIRGNIEVYVRVGGGEIAPHVPRLLLPIVFDHLQCAKAVPGRSCHVSDTICRYSPVVYLW